MKETEEIHMICYPKKELVLLFDCLYGRKLNVRELCWVLE